MKFTIEPDIFPHFPGLKVVVAVARDMASCDVAGIAEELRRSWVYAGNEAAVYGNAQSHPRILPWGERMKAAGAPRKHFPCSIEALVRRAGKQGEPPAIHPIVDFYNAISLKHIVPAGGYDIDGIKEDVRLRFSKPGDTFLALDEDAEMPVEPGEVSYADGSVIITRQFVWKQSRHLLITPQTRNVFFVSEILGELPDEVVHHVAKDFEEGITRFFGVMPHVDVLDTQKREIAFIGE